MSNTQSNKKTLSPEEHQDLLKTLKSRFEKNINHHKELLHIRGFTSLQNCLDIIPI